MLLELLAPVAGVAGVVAVKGDWAGAVEEQQALALAAGHLKYREWTSKRVWPNDRSVVTCGDVHPAKLEYLSLANSYRLSASTHKGGALGPCLRAPSSAARLHKRARGPHNTC